VVAAGVQRDEVDPRLLHVIAPSCGIAEVYPAPRDPSSSDASIKVPHLAGRLPSSPFASLGLCCTSSGWQVQPP
jgi:hypothetical protein